RWHPHCHCNNGGFGTSPRWQLRAGYIRRARMWKRDLIASKHAATHRRSASNSFGGRAPALPQLRPRFPKAMPLALPCPRALTLTGADIIEAWAEKLAAAGSPSLPPGPWPNPSAIKNESGSNVLSLELAKQMRHHTANRAMERMLSPVL